MNKTLYLICGTPGSGKTTMAKALVASGLAHRRLETDMWFTSVDDTYKFNQHKVVINANQCVDAARTVMKGGMNLVVSNTFTKQAYLQPYLDLAKEFGYNVVEMVCKSTYTNVHNVPPEIVDAMKNNLQKRLNNGWATQGFESVGSQSPHNQS